MEQTNRQLALQLAVGSKSMDGSLDVLATAQGYLGFLEGAPAGEAAPAPTKGRSKKSTAAASASAEAAASPASEPSTAAAASPSEPEAPADDFSFDEPAKPEEKVKEYTEQDIRAKLVEVQTKLKHKGHAIACIKKVTGGETLSGLKKDKFAALIAAADEAIKTGKTDFVAP